VLVQWEEGCVAGGRRHWGLGRRERRGMQEEGIEESYSLEE
jgi:hypothetical protein